MSKSDQWANIILVIFIVLHLSVLIIGFISGKAPWLAVILNLIVGLSIVIYWLQKELRIVQHNIESTEIIVLCFEVAVIGLSIYLLSSGRWTNWLKTVQYVFFGIHFLCLVAFLVFMLTFKMNKLI